MRPGAGQRPRSWGCLEHGNCAAVTGGAGGSTMFLSWACCHAAWLKAAPNGLTAAEGGPAVA